MNSLRNFPFFFVRLSGQMAYVELIALGVVVALGIVGTFVVPGPDKAYVILAVGHSSSY